MAEVWVTCVSRIPHNNPHEGITHLGGRKWKWTRQQVIASIEAGQHTFRANVPGMLPEIGIVEGPRGKYLQAIVDGSYNDSLLTLGECREMTFEGHRVSVK